nr:EOG090X0KP6 [Triops cancriformis]
MEKQCDQQTLSTLGEDENNTTRTLTTHEKAKVERNRQRALMLRQARLQSHPYKNAQCEKEFEGTVIRVQNRKLVDTGGGFLLDPSELEEQQNGTTTVKALPAPIIEPDRPHCEECEQTFADSFLYRSFDAKICDACKDLTDEDGDSKFGLVTRTEAKTEYLLKECDLDKREPILKFISRKNPHNERWGNMKLYFRPQIEDRALSIWGSVEALEDAKQTREDNREKAKVKKFTKQVKALRMAVRSSIYHKERSFHKHTFGPEESQGDDMYSKTCTECGHVETYEKM